MTSTSFEPIWLPTIELAHSRLLQAAFDGRFFRFWEFERDGHYAYGGEIKTEVDALVAEIIERNGEAKLLAAAQQDDALMNGFTFRGPDPFDVDTDGVRVAAMRQLDLLIGVEIRRHFVTSLEVPSTQHRAYATVPGLLDQLDRRGLFPLSPDNVDTEKRSSDCLILVGDHALYPNPHMRENRELVGDLMRLTLAKRSVRIALDPYRVIDRETRPQILLLDYWYGVRIDESNLDDPSAVGAARHERPIDMHDKHTFPLLAIDVKWSVDGDLKTLQIDETVPITDRSRDDGVVFNRYLHAQRDWRQKKWIHVDGAIKSYAPKDYGPTPEHTNLPKGESAYRKLWRLDDDISNDDFGRLLGHHFRHNELVLEYFGELIDDRPG